MWGPACYAIYIYPLGIRGRHGRGKASEIPVFLRVRESQGMLLQVREFSNLQ